MTAVSDTIPRGNGKVVFADEFRGYGKLVIIDAGDNYHIILGGLGQIDVDVGQIVSARDRLGTMPLVEGAMLNSPRTEYPSTLLHC